MEHRRFVQTHRFTFHKRPDTIEIGAFIAFLSNDHLLYYVKNPVLNEGADGYLWLLKKPERRIKYWSS